MRKLFVVLLCCSATLSASAQSSSHWFEVTSPHFRVLTDTNEKQGRKIAGQFERMRSLFHAVLPNAGGDAGAPIIVLALKDRKGFIALEPAAYLAKNALPLAGLFLRTQDQNYILVRLDTEDAHPFSIVYHEYTHFVLRKAEWLPLWMNEGLAEFYQNTDIYDKEVRLGQPSTDDILFLRENKLIPISTLLMVDHASPYYHDEQKGSVFYAESWALIHYIEITDFQNHTHHLQDYAHLLASKHEDPVTAAQHVFGDLNQLQKALDAYVSSADFREFKMSTSFTADESAFHSRPLPLTDVNAARADVLAHDDRVPEALSLLQAVLKEDPNNAAALEAMGHIRFSAQDIQGARTYYAEAIKANSQSYFAHYFFAVLTMQSGDKTQDDAVESSLNQAIKLEPSFAPSYDALARFYAMHNEKLDDAHMLLLKAVEIDPDDINYRLNTAQVLVQQKNFDSALRVLDATLRVATPADKANVEQRIAEVKQYQTYAERSTPSATAEGNTHPATDQPRTILMTQNSPGLGTVSDVERTYPVPAADAKQHAITGVLRNVKCSYPTGIDFDVVQTGKTLSLFAPNFYKIAFTTANYTPTGDIMPCTGIEGMKALVAYTDVTDKTLAGQAVAIELSK